MSNFILIPQEKFDELSNKVDQLLILLDRKREIPVTLDDWVPEAFAQKLLGLKKTSLWYLRKHKKIVYSKVGAKIFYSRKSIDRLLNKNQV